MAWEKVLCSCGHYSDIQLLGKAAEREKKIQWFKDAGLCKDCYKQHLENQKALINEIIEMDYRSQYKVMFEWCEKVRDSYNKDTKTIKVYVPKDTADFAKAFVADDKISQFEALAKMHKEGAGHVYDIIKRVSGGFAKECREYFEQHYPEFYEEEQHG